MDSYLEYSVAGERGSRERMLYAFWWAAVAILAAIALVSAASILGFTDAGMRIRWANVLVTILAAALAVLAFRMKDGVYREYDYILWNAELEISGVYNRKRRKKLRTIPLGKLTAWGPADAMAGPMHGAKRQLLCVHPERALCLVYSDGAGKQAVLVELSEEMCRQIRATSRALRDAEVRP